MLLTTEEVREFEDAARIIDPMDTPRCRIEEWHDALNSGCKVIEHHNATVEPLKRVIAIDVVLALRIQLMTPAWP